MRRIGEARRGADTFLGLGLLLLPSVALADITWTWQDRLGMEVASKWWVVSLTILLEWPVVRYLTGAGWIRSLMGSVLMNALSATVGFLLPDRTVRFFAKLTLRPAGDGPFLGLALPAALGTGVEWTALRLAFGARFRLWGILLLWTANLLTALPDWWELFSRREQLRPFLNQLFP